MFIKASSSIISRYHVKYWKYFHFYPTAYLKMTQYRYLIMYSMIKTSYFSSSFKYESIAVMCCASSEHSITHWDLKTNLPKGLVLEQNVCTGKQGGQKSGYDSKYSLQKLRSAGRRIKLTCTSNRKHLVLYAGEIVHDRNMKLHVFKRQILFQKHQFSIL